MTHFLSLHRVGLLVALLLASAASTLYAQTITTFDIPDSTATRPLAINLEGQIAGSYMPATPDQFGDLFVFDQRGFVREPDGTVRSIDGKFLGEPYTASATAINLQGRAIGNMRYDVDSVFSFVRETDGTVTAVRYDPSHSDAQVDVPNYVRGTTPTDINDWGQIVGVFAEPPSNIGLLRQVNGTFTTFFIPRIDSFPETFPQAINDLGQITGYAATDGTFAFHGFLRQRDGTFVVFDPLDSTGTYAQAINLLGEITGSYTTADGVSHGLLRKHNGNIITFDPPGSIGTQSNAINLEGQIVGWRGMNVKFADALGAGSGGRAARESLELRVPKSDTRVSYLKTWPFPL